MLIGMAQQEDIDKQLHNYYLLHKVSYRIMSYRIIYNIFPAGVLVDALPFYTSRITHNLLSANREHRTDNKKVNSIQGVGI